LCGKLTLKEGKMKGMNGKKPRKPANTPQPVLPVSFCFNKQQPTYNHYYNTNTGVVSNLVSVRLISVGGIMCNGKKAYNIEDLV